MARPPHSSPELLIQSLRHGPLSARELSERLGVSQPTISRMLAEVRQHIVVGGSAANTRYALTQRISPRLPGELPVVQVDEDGLLIDAGRLCTVSPHNSWFSFTALGWPDDPDCRDGFRDGLPYFVTDMQPQGYLGRAFARRMATTLSLPDDPREWRDEDVLFSLATFGYDMPGNLIIGDDAIRRFEDHTRHPPIPLSADDPSLLLEYEQLAINAGRSGEAGSSAAGEFPKFIAIRESLREIGTPHVIVKFSGNDGSPPVSRWSDLLVCEHLALETITHELQLTAAHSRILQHQGRTFLEVERFDRVGLFGRKGVASLGALNNALLGSSATRWDELISSLAPLIRLHQEEVRNVHLLSWFGRMIANTDMHFGNLAFMMGETVSLAPAYDMLPMKYAPATGGEVRQAELLRPENFTMPYSQRATLAGVWNRARSAALTFWRRASEDHRITPGFREICQGNLAVIEHVGPQAERPPVRTKGPSLGM